MAAGGALTATDRARQRRRHRLRHKRLWADLRRRERDGKLIAQEAYEQEREAAELDAELRLAGASGIYDLAVYLAIRRPAGERRRARRAAAARWRATSRPTPTRACTPAASWSRTRGSPRCPLGVDRLRRDAARSRSATSATACRCCRPARRARGGVPLGYATPGQTLERVDFFDPRYRTHVALVTGASGSGKTVAVNALLARNLARGATGYIIDRSSSEDEGGSHPPRRPLRAARRADPRRAQ